MSDLFGLDIAGLVNDAITAAGGVRPATLTKSVNGARTSGALAEGNNPTTTTHTCQAFIDSSIDRLPGQLSAQGGRFVSILGASISPAAVPEPSDVVTVDGVAFSIAEVPEIDPARALYVCRVVSA